MTALDNSIFSSRVDLLTADAANPTSATKNFCNDSREGNVHANPDLLRRKGFISNSTKNT